MNAGVSNQGRKPQGSDACDDHAGLAVSHGMEAGRR